ncbi:MAG: DegV family protein [Clostridiales bacterium]|nr:DegV family protein [Clostridiales bacterium]
MSYTIFTDSSSGLPLLITSKYDIKVIPLTCIINGEETLIKCDDEEFLKDFYTRLRDKQDMMTACINEQTFFDYFKAELEKGLDVIYIGLSSGLSATIENANKASETLKKQFPDRKIFIVDSLNACLGEGLLTFTALQKREEGCDLTSLYNHLLSIRLNANSLFTVKTLTYLAKGGRISKLSMAIGTVADVKPIMFVNNEGKLVSEKKVIGRKRSVLQIAENFIKTIENPETQTIFIGHGDCLEDAKLLASTISQKVKVKEFIFNYIDPVIAIHSGPDTLAIFGYGKSR